METVKIKAPIVIKGNVTLDLNGWSITRDEQSLCGAIRVMGADASLTLTDSSKEQSGKIYYFSTGAYNPLDGGVYVDGGSFIMNGGVIDSCSGQHGGGVYLTGGASFTMNDGRIKNCKAQERGAGGGVYVGAGCTFMMEDGVIDSCESTEGPGGGVYVARGGTFEMSGGSIESCRMA